MKAVKTFGLLGTGVIGAGWAARALHAGDDVIAADLNPAMEDWLRGAIETAAPALAMLTKGMELPGPGTLSVVIDHQRGGQVTRRGPAAGHRRHDNTVAQGQRTEL